MTDDSPKLSDGDLILASNSHGTIFLGIDRGRKTEWIADSSVSRGVRTFHLHGKPNTTIPAKDFTAGRIRKGEGLYLVDKYLARSGDVFGDYRGRRLFSSVGGYRVDYLGTIGNSKKPTKESRKLPTVPEADRKFVEGAILYTSWGYDQTNTEFYKVTWRKGHYVGVKAIETREETDEDGFMTGVVYPGADIPGTPELRRRVAVYDGEESSVKIDGDFHHAYPWDGKPKRVSHYA